MSTLPALLTGRAARSSGEPSAVVLSVLGAMQPLPVLQKEIPPVCILLLCVETIQEHGPDALIPLTCGTGIDFETMKVIFHALCETKYIDCALQSKQTNQPANDRAAGQQLELRHVSAARL